MSQKGTQKASQAIRSHAPRLRDEIEARPTREAMSETIDSYLGDLNSEEPITGCDIADALIAAGMVKVKP